MTRTRSPRAFSRRREPEPAADVISPGLHAQLREAFDQAKETLRVRPLTRHKNLLEMSEPWPTRTLTASARSPMSPSGSGRALRRAGDGRNGIDSKPSAKPPRPSRLPPRRAPPISRAKCSTVRVRVPATTSRRPRRPTTESTIPTGAEPAKARSRVRAGRRPAGKPPAPASRPVFSRRSGPRRCSASRPPGGSTRRRSSRPATPAARRAATSATESACKAVA